MNQLVQCIRLSHLNQMTEMSQLAHQLARLVGSFDMVGSFNMAGSYYSVG